jgi:hypothetical protein
VVERILGKAEVDSSILSGGTIPSGVSSGMTQPSDPPSPALKGDPGREQRLAQALRANLKRRKAQAQSAAARPATAAKGRDK